MKRLCYAFALVALAAAGCGGSTDAPVTAPVSGTVIVKGEPKSDLNVLFYPESGGRPATGTTGPGGKFTLTTDNTGDGATIGRNKVAISGGAGGSFAETGPPMPGQAGYAEWMAEEASKLDPKYADPEKSGLLYTVPAEGLPNVEIKID